MGKRFPGRRKSEKHYWDLLLEREGMGLEREAGGQRSRETSAKDPIGNGLWREAKEYFYHEHCWSSEPYKWAKRAYELSVFDEMSRAEIARQLNKEGYPVYRRIVGEVLTGFNKAIKEGNYRTKRGRPRLEDGHGGTSRVVGVRLSEVEQMAARKVETSLKKRIGEVIRDFIMALARQL